MRIEEYGAGGEKLFHAQMELFGLAPAVSEIIEQAESEHATVRGAATCERIRQPSKPPGIVCKSSVPRADSALHAGSVRVQTLWQRNSGDRLQREFPAGRGAGEVLRAGHETRETGLLIL
jgi:hypothetical protein